MVSSEARRHRLYESVKASHGEETAVDLLESLPPAGLPDLATKDDIALVLRDVQALRDLMDHRFALVDHRFEALEDRLDGRFQAIDERFQAIDERVHALREYTESVHQSLRHELVGQIDRGFRDQTLRLVWLVFGGMTALGGAVGVTAQLV